MKQTNLPSNAINKPKEKPKDLVKPVVTGKVKKKSKSFGEKFVENFINDDVSDVKGYLVSDVIVPTIKKTVIDVIKMFFYGKTSGPGPGGAEIVPYNQMSRGRTYLMGSSNAAPKRVSKKTFDDIWFENRGDLEVVVDNLNAIIDTYQVVSVFDLLELAGQQTVFTDNRFGWTDLRGMQIVHNSNGYVLKMPPPRPIE